jgi:hypothetical protein
MTNHVNPSAALFKDSHSFANFASCAAGQICRTSIEPDRCNLIPPAQPDWRRDCTGTGRKPGRKLLGLNKVLL